MNNVINEIIEQVPYKSDEPSELYVIMKRKKDPLGPPEQYQVFTQVDWQNFPNPMEILNALEIAKATVINIMMQQQQAQAGQNPNFKRPPWVKDRN